MVDAGVLHFMVAEWNTNLFVARGCSFTCAATTTWLINRIITFAAPRRRPRRLAAEWTAYFSASVAGGCINYLVFVLGVSLFPLLHRIPTVAVALGSLAGMILNFLLYSRYVFRPLRQDSPG